MKPEIINSSSLEYPFWDPILHPISYIENIPWKLLKILKKKKKGQNINQVNNLKMKMKLIIF